MNHSATILNTICGFLLFYTMFIAYLFRGEPSAQRQWRSLDYLWVPLGGVAGLCLLVVMWRTSGHAH